MSNQILFVDDEPSVLQALSLIVKTTGYDWTTVEAASAKEAFVLMNSNNVDVIVSDLMMPGTDGFAFLEELKSLERFREIPLIILTGSIEDGLKRRALDLGAIDLLNKPIGQSEFIARIRSALQLKKYQDTIRKQNETLEEKVRERTSELEESRLEMIWHLAKAGEYRDEETGNHVVRVGCYSRVLAEAMRKDRDFQELIFLTSPMHDIGKIGIPDSILLKKGKLTPEERNVIERHCAIGAAILSQEPKGMTTFLNWRGEACTHECNWLGNPLLRMASTIALSHHEWWDGSGYPHGLKEEQIPLEARIVALADVYDALGSERPYKPAFPEAKVLSILNEESGRHFDPLVISAFEQSIDAFRKIRRDFPENDSTGGAEQENASHVMPSLLGNAYPLAAQESAYKEN